MPLVENPFLFLRHAQSACNAAGRIGGWTDSPLTPKGMDQARAAGHKLAGLFIGHLASSPLKRTRMTAGFARPDCPVTLYPGLKERDWGQLEGRPVAEMTNRFATPLSGESWDGFCHRTIRCLNQILSSQSHPLIVSHSGVFRAIYHSLGLPPDGGQIPNASIWSFTPPRTPEKKWDIKTL